MPIGPIGGAILGTLGSAIVGKLLGGKSGSEKAAERAGAEAAQAEAQLLNLIRDLGLDANQILGGLQEGGRPPVFRIDLDNPTDIEEFFGQVAPMAGFNNTLRLIQALKGVGTANVQQGSLLAAQTGRDRAALTGNIASNIVAALLARQNAATPSSLPVGSGVDVGSFANYPLGDG